MEVTDSFLTLLQNFVPVFTAPTYQTFVVIVTGWIISQRHRYVTEASFLQWPCRRRTLVAVSSLLQPRGRRSSASFAIHDISGIPGSPMDRVEEFASWRGPRRGPSFLAPYLAGYSEFERTHRLDGSAGITRSAIEATPASQATSPTWSRRRCKGHVLPDLAGGKYHLAELITRDTP